MRRRAAVWLMLAALQGGCVRTHVGDTATAVTGGGVSGAALSVGGQDYALAVCRSGDWESFFGVDLADREGQATVRVVVDPIDGPRLRVAVAGTAGPKRMAFGASSCRRLEARIEPTGWWVNEFRDFSGSLEADCTGEAGLEVVAHVRFAHCH